MATNYKKKIIDNMEQIGTYKEEFEIAINQLAKLLTEMDEARKEFEKNGSAYVMEYTNKGGATNLVKNPYYTVIADMRKDIISYARELGLTAAGLKKIQGEIKAQESKKQSAFSSALKIST